MKKRIKCTALSFCICIFILFGSINPVSADTTPEIEDIFNWAENNFSEFFSDPQATQMIGEWTFRRYPFAPSGETYIGANNNDIFVLGGPWGTDAPLFVDTVSNLTSQIASSGGDVSVPGCNSDLEIPAGMTITQSGNVVNITTNGQCIVIPEEESNFCEAPEQLEATGISVLTTVNVTSSETTGIEIDQPGIFDPIGSIADGFTNASCTINASPESTVINSDVCFDVTDQFSSLSSIPGVTVSPPVTFAIASTTTDQIVANCFDTNATSISDAFTGESWVIDTISGGFIQISF